MPGGWEWLIILAVVMVLFGVKRLPDMARSIGQSARVFKGEMKGLREDDASAAQPPAPAQPAPAPQPAPPVQPQLLVGRPTIIDATIVDATIVEQQPVSEGSRSA